MISLLSAWVGRAPQLQKNPNIGDRFIEEAVAWHLRASGRFEGESLPVFCARAAFDRAALATVNRSRALVLCGSNLLHRDFWPGYMKLSKRLSSIRVPLVAWGVGWGGERPREGYRFRPQAVEALHWMIERFPVFSVRDPITRELLEEQVPAMRGKIRLTGCPVLFRFNRGRFDAAGLAGAHGANGGGAGDGAAFAPRRILFSSNERLHLDAHVALFRRVRSLFPEAEITVALNQESDAFTSRLGGEPFGVFRGEDVEAWYRAFEAHDFQIGFRLHNHMAFLSLSKPSLTVEVDGRTAGFARMFDLENFAPDSIPGLDRARLLGLLQRNADRLPRTGAERWGAMEELVERLAALPEPTPPGLLARWLDGRRTPVP